jgi:hypothetical protein
MPKIPLSDNDYDVDELREAAGLEQLEDVDEPNYQCMTCGWPTNIDDHQVHTPNWCDRCDDIKTFEKL